MNFTRQAVAFLVDGGFPRQTREPDHLECQGNVARHHGQNLHGGRVQDSFLAESQRDPPGDLALFPEWIIPHDPMAVRGVVGHRLGFR